MPSTSNAPPLRQSCDRCHRQKLRCTRASGSNIGICDRCLRKHVQCVYSVSLPKGRPSIYKTADEPTDTTASVMITPESSASSAVSHTRSSDSGVADADSDIDVAFNAVNAKAGADAKIDGDADADADAHTHTVEDGDPFGGGNAGADACATENGPASIHERLDSDSMDPSMDPSMDVSASAWLWPQNFAEMDVHMDWREAQLTPSRQPVLDNRLYADPSAFEFFPNNLGRPNMGRDGGDDGRAIPASGRPSSPFADMMPMSDSREAHSASDDRGMRRENTNDRSIGGGSDGNSKTAALENEDLDIVITQLTRLSIRLGSLRLSSYALAKTAESSSPLKNDSSGPRFKLLDDSAFDSVATWLAQEANGCAKLLTLSSSMTPDYHGTYPKFFGSEPVAGSRCMLLHDVLSSSHHLLEVLRYLQASCQVDSSTSTLSKPTCSPVPPNHIQLVGALAGRDLFGQTRDSSPNYTFPSSQRSDNHIIRNLIIACHTLLLTIYLAMFAVLEHDACQPSGAMDTAALGQIRLVSVVQLCSYLIERQHQAVGQYLWGGGNLPQNMSVGDFGNPNSQQQGLPPVLVMGDREAIVDLENEVQNRLAQLQKILRA